MIRALTLLLLSSTCFGQLTMQSMQPFFNGSSSSPIVADLQDAAYRWVAADVTTNAAISGNWSDRIQSFAFLMGASTLRPTNSQFGVWFDNTHFLTNTGSIINSNVAFGFIMCVSNVIGGGSGIMPTLTGNNFSGADGAGRLDYRFNSAASSYDLSTANNGTVTSIQSPSGPFAITNVYFDLVISQTISNNGHMGMRAYTNGVLMKAIDISSTIVSGGFYFGSAGGNNSASTAPSLLMRNGSRLTSASAFLFEHWIWTNGTPGDANGTDISPTVLAHFHRYGTNAYHYSP